MAWNFLTIVPALLAAGSAVAAAWAWRGRRVDDHSVCRRCRFDLFGRPAGAAAVCPECGSDLGRRRAVRVGNRARRRRVMGLAVLLLITSGGWLGVLGVGTSRHTDWNRHKPVWWLAADTGSKGPSVRDAALAELVRRVDEGKLSDAQLAGLVDRGLAHQADSGQPWVAGWGQLVEAAHDKGRLPADKWKRYALNGFPLRLTVRPRVRRGDSIPVVYGPDPPRVASPRLQARFDVGPELYLPAGVVSGAASGTAGLLSSGLLPASMAARYPGASVWPSDDGWQVYAWPTPLDAGLRDGRQTASIHYELRVSDGTTRFVDPDRAAAADWELLPAGASSTALVVDPARRAAAERAVSLTGGRLVRHPAGDVGLDFAAPAPPMAMAFDVFIRQGDREWPASGVVRFQPRRTGLGVVGPGPGNWKVMGFGGPTWAQARSTMAHCPGLTAGRADVILRPNAAGAAGTVDVVEIWGGEVVFKDVAVVDAVTATGQPQSAGGPPDAVKASTRPAAGVE